MKRVVWLFCILAMLLASCGKVEETAVVTPPAGAAPTASLAPLPKAIPSHTPAAEGPAVVRFALMDWDRPNYEPLIQAFQDENPDITIEVVSVNELLDLGAIAQMEFPEDTDQRLVAGADVVTLGLTSEGVAKGLYLDLSPLLQADPAFQSNDFYAGTLERYQWDGGTWALPTTVNFQLVFFSKDAFDQALEPYPEPGWSWDDLLAKAQALTVRDGDKVTRWGFVPAGAGYRLIESCAGGLADYDADPIRPYFDESRVVEAVTWYTDLHRTHQVMPFFDPAEAAEGALLSEESTLVDTGAAALWIETDLLWFYRSQQANVGVVPFPVDGPDDRTTPASTGFVAVSAGSRVPQAAWRWAEYVSRQEVGGLSMGMKYLPARLSTAESSGFWDGLDEGYAAALRYALDHSYLPRGAVGYELLTQALTDILSDKESVATALAQAQDETEADLETQAVAAEKATPLPTFVVAPPQKTAAVAGAAITFTPALGSFNLDPYRQLAEQFHQEHPEISVEVKMADLMGGVTTLDGMAKSADCFEWFPGFEEAKYREAILSLQPFLDAAPSFKAGDFYPQALELFTWEGQVLGLPSDISPLIIEYNKDLFDAARVSLPTADWSWDDFLAAAVALTKGEGKAKQYGFVAEVYEINDLVLITERLGAKLIDMDADPPALSFDDPATIAAMRWYAGLTTEHEVKPVFLTDLSKLLGASAMTLEREEVINSGRAAMWTSASTTAAVMGERTGLNIGAAPFPGRPDGSSAASFLTVSGYFISAQTQQRQACWQWITFLTGEPAVVSGLPARRSVAESAPFRQKAGAERAEAYLASMSDSERPSSFQLFSEEGWLGTAMYWYSQAYGQIVDGKVSVEEALGAAQQMADDYRACITADGSYGEEAIKTCAKQVDPTLPDFLFAGGG